MPSTQPGSQFTRFRDGMIPWFGLAAWNRQCQDFRHIYLIKMIFYITKRPTG